MRPDSGSEGLGPWGSPPYTPSQEPGRGTVGRVSRKSQAPLNIHLAMEGCFGTTSQKKMVFNDSLEIFMTHTDCRLCLLTPSSQLHLCYKSKRFGDLFDFYFFKISKG